MRLDAPPGETSTQSLEAWRALLVRRVVCVSVIASLLPCGLVTSQAWRSGSWGHAVFTWVVTGILAIACAPGRLPHAWRAGLAVGMLYLFGLWLLVHGSAVGPLFLLACPVMAALGLGPRHSLVALLGCTASLVGVGWQLQIPFPLIDGSASGSAVRWLIVGSNMLLLSLLMSLSCAFLLQRLERALSQQQGAALSLQRSEQLLREVASQVPGMVFRMRSSPVGDSRFLYVSPGSRDLLGLAPDDLLRQPELLAKRVLPDDRVRLREHMVLAWAGRRQQTLELRLRHPQRGVRWVQLQANEVERDADGVVHNGIITDITERKAAEARVWEQAHIDPLTRLPNRLRLNQQLALAMADSRRTGRSLALMMLDLDRFKEVNDSLGHACGDQLLVQAARRLQDGLRENDMVARMGGDEFTVLLPALVDPTDVQTVGRRALAVLADAFELESERVHVSASIGIALFPEDAASPEDLLKHADQAMYRAKEGGRNRMCRFTPELQVQAQLRMRLGLDLRSALALGQLRLEYQPVVHLGSGQVCKAEALLRWRHPDLGDISPSQFIPIAESTGQIGEIGDWVFHSAARQVKAWRRSLHPDFQISLNRSPLQFRSEFAPRQPWPEVLRELGVPGSAIVVEITEGLLLDPDEAVARQLAELRAAGMALSLDDFGTGYSALAYLHRYELDVLKIDRSFVSGLSAGQTGRSLCRAMVLMAQELGMRVVAEGVETAEQRDWLLRAGCELGQGYFFARSMAADQFEQWLGRRHASVDDSSPAAALASVG